MTKHMKIKNKVKQINSKTVFNELLEDCMLSEKEKQLMKMYYIEQKDFDYIADILGYSKAGVLKMHNRILNKLETLI